MKARCEGRWKEPPPPDHVVDLICGVPGYIVFKETALSYGGHGNTELWVPLVGA
jgi:hypothetical protein